MKILVLFLWILQMALWNVFGGGVCFAQDIPGYEIQAKIDVAARRLSAVQTTQWTNPAQTEVSELVFHIYPNRRYTPQEKDLLWRFAGYFKVDPFPEGFQTGAMKIVSVSQDKERLEFSIDGDDQTILSVKLAQSVKPGQSVKVTIDFSVEIPHITLGRFGWHDNVFRFSRWYPILSVYDPVKGWNKNPGYPFHRPFFSESAGYKVALTVPIKQKVISSAAQTGAVIDDDGTQTTTYQSHWPIREFSFAMSPDYQEVSEEVGGVWIKSFYLPQDRKSAEMALNSAKELMKFYERQFGKYPHEVFSIAPVDLGYGGEQMSNMIFIDRRAYRLPGMMRRYFDFLVAHETGHQWFYNVVGINEYEHMWLEEGLNSYFIEQYLSKKYGEDGQVIDFPAWAKNVTDFLPKLTFKNARDTRYKSIARVGKDHAVVSKLSSFAEPSAIFSVTYGKGARVLGMLKNYLGDEAFEKVFRKVFEEYRFRNLSVEEFVEICQKEHGGSLAWFFDSWLYSQEPFNYALQAKDGRIVLENHGGIRMPADIVVEKKDGARQRLTITLYPDEKLSWPRSEIKSISVDPDNKLLDIDRTNNYWPRRLHAKIVPFYSGLEEIPVFLPDDGYSLIAGPRLANNGLGVKGSLQKPYDQIFYAQSDYEFGEQLFRSGAGYELKNFLKTQTVLGVEISNTTDYDDGDDDLASGKVYVRRELSPAQYSVTSANDHAVLYMIRNQSIRDGAGFLSGQERMRNADYGRRKEAIVGSALHLDRSGTSPDPSLGYKMDIFAESAGHFWGATQYFWRGAMDTSVYWAVTEKTKTAFRFQIGGGYPDDKVLFYTGGQNGLRGYERKTIRGTNMVLGSFEYRFPIAENLKLSCLDNILGLEKISGVVFADAGQVWFSSPSAFPWRTDAGVGLRFMVNIGSLFEKVIVRVDIAQAINDEDEDKPRFLMGINHAF